MLPKTSKYNDVDQLLDVCTQIKDEIITTVDACMAQSPQRRDLIAIFMEHGHIHTMEVLQHFWEKQSVKLSAFDTLSLVDWCYTYLTQLRQFGISDLHLQNGLNNLCNAYSRKVHSQINPLVVCILQQEVDFGHSVVEMGDQVLSTNAPNDLV